MNNKIINTILILVMLLPLIPFIYLDFKKQNIKLEQQQLNLISENECFKKD